jgi:hypothetical protein
MKIKSVRLLKDLPGCKSDITLYGDYPFYRFIICPFTRKEIIDNPDFFKVEYENERKYIDVRIEYYDDTLLGAFPTNYFNGFSDFMLRNCSHEREIKVTETGRGIL